MLAKALDTTVFVPKREIPQSFQRQSIQANITTDTTTIAALEWRRYFQDSLLVALIDTALQNNFDL
ncbi:MAG: TolC family protein, partial [Candidatus Kapaibacteriota bacterium]